MSQARVVPRVINIYEPDLERCLQTIARALKVTLNPAAPATAAPVAVMPAAGATHSVQKRRRRANHAPATPATPPAAARPRKHKEATHQGRKAQKDGTL